MRVGMVAGEYPPMQGGVGAFTREVARAMAADGHHVFVLTRMQVSDVSEQGIAVTPAVRGRWGWHTIRIAREWARRNALDVLNVQFQTAAYDLHPAIHWLPGSIGAPPVVVTFHDLRVPYLFPKAGPLRPWIVRRLAREAAGVIATDRADLAVLRDQWGIRDACWIPIGSNVSTTPPPGYDRDSWRASMGVAADDLLISYFGFLNESKGGLVVIEALAQLVAQGVPAQVVMIGGRAGSSDPTNLAYGQRVDALIAAHGLEGRVHWTGFVSDAEVSANFYASDLTALPYRDGVSLRRGTLMAALAHGRAIVTTCAETDAPELEGVVESVPADSAARLAAAILRVWRDSALRERLERGALEAARLFTWDQIAARTIEYFGQVQSG